MAVKNGLMHLEGSYVIGSIHSLSGPHQRDSGDGDTRLIAVHGPSTHFIGDYRKEAERLEKRQKDTGERSCPLAPIDK